MTKLHIINDLKDQDKIQILKVPCEPFNFENPPEDPLELTKNLIETMYDANGIGLAANQVGLNYRLFVMRGTEDSGDFSCFNPRIVWLSDEHILLEEGCLSYPGVVVKIKRPRHVRLRFEAPSGETITHKFTGITARVIQHEMDHLNGVLFYNNANKYYRDRAFKNRHKYDVGQTQNILQKNISAYL